MSLNKDSMCIECNERVAHGTRLYCYTCGYSDKLIKNVKRIRKPRKPIEHKKSKDGIMRPWWYSDK